MDEDVQPVQTSEIKAFLAEHSLTFDKGFTSLITTCPRLNHTKLKLTDINKVFINSTTGSDKLR